MTPAKYPLKFRRGADWHKVFTHRGVAGYRADDTPIPGAPFDLTGCTARMQIRSDLESPVVLDTLDTENGRLVLVNRLVDLENPLSGYVLGGIDMIFPNAVSSAYAWSDAVYDLEIIRSNGWVDCMIETSPISLTGEVTRI